jgi:hypothetical protein
VLFNFQKFNPLIFIDAFVLISEGMLSKVIGRALAEAVAHLER